MNYPAVPSKDLSDVPFHCYGMDEGFWNMRQVSVYIAKLCRQLTYSHSLHFTLNIGVPQILKPVLLHLQSSEFISLPPVCRDQGEPGDRKGGIYSSGYIQTLS